MHAGKCKYMPCAIPKPRVNCPYQPHQLSLQRVRLLLWGETLGLGFESPQRYHPRLDSSDIAPAIESTLHHLRSLLQKADLITDRYTVPAGSQAAGDVQVEPSKGLTIFRDRFDSFKVRIRRSQSSNSTWTVTRWAVHDLGKFRAVITNIKDLIDGLEGITSALGLLERQQALLAHEVDSICDTQSLRLLHELGATEDCSSSLKLVSDTASVRLSIFAESIPYTAFRPSMAASNRSYRTALSHRYDASIPSLVEELSEEELSLHSAEQPSKDDTGRIDSVTEWQPGPSDDEKRRNQLGVSSRDSKSQVDNNDAQRDFPMMATVPQNQRLISELMRKSTSPLPQLRFDCGSSSYGNAMAAVKKEDAESWAQRSTRFLVQADRGVLSARRIFLELRSIRYANVPFISAAPLGDCLDKMIARIEGPPDTPYEGGVFWILVSFSSVSETEPPLLRFLTRIYHPNIDCNGNICADYHAWWNELEHIGTSTKSTKEAWFSARKSNWYSLGALLTALCGLLASPNIDDPLVVEIAETYIRSHADYCSAARRYTQMYARKDVRPQEYYDIAMKQDGLDATTPRIEPYLEQTSGQETTTTVQNVDLWELLGIKGTEGETPTLNSKEMKMERDATSTRLISSVSSQTTGATSKLAKSHKNEPPPLSDTGKVSRWKMHFSQTSLKLRFSGWRRK